MASIFAKRKRTKPKATLQQFLTTETQRHGELNKLSVSVSSSEAGGKK